MKKETQKKEYQKFAKEKLKQIIEFAIFNQSHESIGLFTHPVNSRAYNCSVDLCGRLAYAKGLCNAHYIRKAKGKSIDAPIKSRKQCDLCSLCGEKTQGKGGWGLCAKHYKNKRYQIIKDAVIKEMGGSCMSCGGVFSRSVYDFHHTGDKSDSPSAILSNSSIDKIAEELSRCVLLCANCHRMEHSDEL